MRQTRFNSVSLQAERLGTSDPEGLYPIRTVSALTGVNPVTLRAWERRHGLIRPQRTPKGHRLYTEADIDRIHRILGLLQQGISIGQTRRLIDGAMTASPAANRGGDADWNGWDELRQRLLGAVQRFDAVALEATWCHALSLFPADAVSDELMRPVLAELRAAATETPDQAGALHFFNAFVRNKLGARLHHHPPAARGPKLLVAGLPGDPIDGELLLFTLTAITHGYRPVLLGAEVPIAALASTALQCQARATVVFAGSPLTEQACRALAELAGGIETRLFVADSAAADHERIDATGALPLPEDPGQSMAALYQRLGG